MNLRLPQQPRGPAPPAEGTRGSSRCSRRSPCVPPPPYPASSRSRLLTLSPHAEPALSTATSCGSLITAHTAQVVKCTRSSSPGAIPLRGPGTGIRGAASRVRWDGGAGAALTERPGRPHCPGHEERRARPGGAPAAPAGGQRRGRPRPVGLSTAVTQGPLVEASLPLIPSVTEPRTAPLQVRSVGPGMSLLP